MTRPTYQLARFLILRLLGFTYAFAFLSAAMQVRPLLGQRGLTPLGLFLERASTYYGSRTDAFLHFPSIFWFAHGDAFMEACGWIGVVLSLAVFAGFANAIIMFVLWALYLSFVHAGGEWYGYGWEIQTVETGFLAIFLCPLVEWRPFPKTGAPIQIIVLFRWLIVRIMLGAGLIKLRGDECWRDLTCLYSHYETQPIPNPLSPALHFMPKWFHKGGVLFNHLVELIAPWFAFGPRLGRHVAGALFVVFQASLIASGNLAFLNWLTIVPALACFDDSFFKKTFTVEEPARAYQIEAWVVATLIGILSIEPVINLLSSEQLMNFSYTPLHLVNTYGAFGSVGGERNEIIFEGTTDETIDENTVWREYELPCKPGDPKRRPCIVAPYQPRIAWQVWFAAMSNAQEHDWAVHMIYKLLTGDETVKSLLESDPFPQQPPRYIRARLFRYRFAPLGSEAWWEREPIDEWLPPLSKDDPRLLEFLRDRSWID